MTRRTSKVTLLW